MQLPNYYLLLHLPLKLRLRHSVRLRRVQYGIEWQLRLQTSGGRPVLNCKSSAGQIQDCKICQNVSILIQYFERGLWATVQCLSTVKHHVANLFLRASLSRLNLPPIIATCKTCKHNDIIYEAKSRRITDLTSADHTVEKQTLVPSDSEYKCMVKLGYRGEL